MTAVSRQAVERDSRLWTAEQFLAFYMTRPDGERWQLVDGLAMMVAPPMLVHQRIVGNLLTLLEGAESAEFGEAYARILVQIPDAPDFCAAPDIIMASPEEPSEYIAEQFFLALEIVPFGCEREMINRKLELYRSHPANLYSVTVDQDSLHVTLCARDNRWTRTDLRSLDDVLKLAAFGFEANLAAIYSGTPLAG